MNPFKEKSLEDFTIADCESYINRYPYGEHILEVKAHHRKLNSALAKIINLTQDVKKSEQSQVIQKKPQEKTSIKNERKSHKKKIAKVEGPEGGVVTEDNSNVGNMIVRILLSIGLVVLAIAFLPTIMIAKPAFEAIWRGDCDIF